MGFRFRRSFRIVPGVRINLGKRGASVSLGVRGAHTTIGPTGVRNTVGIPGTGASYTSTKSWNSRPTDERLPAEPADQERQYANASSNASGNAGLGWFVAAVLFVILVGVLLSR